jgi:hypothetical protein
VLFNPSFQFRWAVNVFIPDSPFVRVTSLCDSVRILLFSDLCFNSLITLRFIAFIYLYGWDYLLDCARLVDLVWLLFLLIWFLKVWNFWIVCINLGSVTVTAQFVCCHRLLTFLGYESKIVYVKVDEFGIFMIIFQWFSLCKIVCARVRGVCEVSLF